MVYSVVSAKRREQEERVAVSNRAPVCSSLFNHVRFRQWCVAALALPPEVHQFAQSRRFQPSAPLGSIPPEVLNAHARMVVEKKWRTRCAIILYSIRREKRV